MFNRNWFFHSFDLLKSLMDSRLLQPSHAQFDVLLLTINI